MRERKLKFLRIRTENEQDATVYAHGALLAAHIESVIGEVYRPSHAIGRNPSYIEFVIALDADYEEKAIDILRHLSVVERLWRQKVSYDTIWEFETEYTRSLKEEFPSEFKMP